MAKSQAAGAPATDKKPKREPKLDAEGNPIVRQKRTSEQKFEAVLKGTYRLDISERLRLADTIQKECSAFVDDELDKLEARRAELLRAKESRVA